MANIPQISQQTLSKFTDGSPNRLPEKFPWNLANLIPLDTQKKMLLWLSTNYIWPQIQERMPFENAWNKILQMARVQLSTEDLFSNETLDATRAKQNSVENGKTKARVADTVVCDAIQRLTDITHFIAFKEGLPAQYIMPEFVETPESTPEYQPLQKKVKAGNALLKWNAKNQRLKRQSRIAYRQHYQYGISYVRSEFRFKVEPIVRQDNLGQLQTVPEITEIGTTFEPLSLRKLWLNWRLSPYEMDLQPCPFFMDEIPRFAILQNLYHETMNPFGYVNLEQLSKGEYIYQGQETEAVRRALDTQLAAMDNGHAPGFAPSAVAQLLKPEHSVEARYTLYPMMPFDAKTGEFETRANGEPIPYARFIMETYGANIHSGAQTIIRLQEMFYPKGKLPIFSSAHMPDLESGQYCPSIGSLLYSHYKEICLCTEQYFDNKDAINDPPAWISVASPALNTDLNARGAKIKVNGPNDFGWRTVPDATQSTAAMRQMLRDEAQTTSKAVDAILGKAMGSRTSATEASNAFQASMSAITTDIDCISEDLHGEWADRVWDYSSIWIDPDLLREITGQFGFAMTPQEMWLGLEKQTNVGSTFIEKVVRQQNHRYLLEASRNETTLDRAVLWTELLSDMGYDASKIVSDGGREQQIQLASLQAAQTYLGELVLVDPDQDHNIALKVKTAFIKDRNSYWNQTFPNMAQMLIQQIEQHQFFLQLQMQMQLAQQQMAVAQAQLGMQSEDSEGGAGPGRQGKVGGPATSPGQLAQRGGNAQ